MERGAARRPRRRALPRLLSSTFPGRVPQAQLDDLADWLSSLWSLQRAALAGSAGGLSLLRDALALLSALGDAAPRCSERERICIDHACALAADARASSDGADPAAAAAAAQLAGALGGSLEGARTWAAGLLCARIGRPAGMLLWVAPDEGEEEEDPDVSEELPTEARCSREGAARCSRAAAEM